MRIVVLDGYIINPGDLSWDGFERLGEVICFDRTHEEDELSIKDRIGEAEVVITCRTPVPRNVIDECSNLQYIGVMSTKTDLVDISHAKEKGIEVSNISSYGEYSLGQTAIAMLLEICHRIQNHSDSVYHGDWENCEDFSYWLNPIIELSGMTMGIIGYGKAGKVTGEVASALGMNVITSIEHVTIEKNNETVEYIDTDMLLRSSDVIVIHLENDSPAKNIICKEKIKIMKDGVIIINNSDGRYIVEQDLADALNSRKVYAAALDVLVKEPINSGNPLLAAKNCIITPGLSYASKKSRKRILDETAEKIEEFLQRK